MDSRVAKRLPRTTPALPQTPYAAHFATLGDNFQTSPLQDRVSQSSGVTKYTPYTKRTEQGVAKYLQNVIYRLSLMTPRFVDGDTCENSATSLWPIATLQRQARSASGQFVILF